MFLRKPITVACQSVISAFILLFFFFFLGEYIGCIVNSIFPCVHQIKLHCCLCWKLDSPSSLPPLPVTGFVLYCRVQCFFGCFFSSFTHIASKREQSEAAPSIVRCNLVLSCSCLPGSRVVAGSWKHYAIVAFLWPLS